MDECGAGIRRSLGEGGYASAGFAEEFQDAAAVRPWSFTVYPVSDMARARRFYEQVLGLTLSHDFGGQWVEYDVGEGTFAITTYDTGHQPGAKGASVGFEVHDLDAFAGMLKDKGVPFVLDIFPTPVCRMAVVEDPDRNHLVIHKRHAEEKPGRL